MVLAPPPPGAGSPRQQFNNNELRGLIVEVAPASYPPLLGDLLQLPDRQRGSHSFESIGTATVDIVGPHWLIGRS